MVRKTVISQLQTAGEDALERLSQNPAARTAIHGAMQVKERGERLLHALDAIEARLSAIEARLSALEDPRAGAIPDPSELHTVAHAAEPSARADDAPVGFGDPAQEPGEDF
jgi:hypothetical protein